MQILHTSILTYKHSLLIKTRIEILEKEINL
jgi:hypothetical protein